MRLVLTGVLVGALVTGGYVERDDAPEPSPERIERSVNTYSVEGSVEVMVQEPEDDAEGLVIGSDVMFAFGSAELDDAAQGALDALIDELPDGAVLEVGGHTDSRGGDEVNVPLSQSRADAVAAAITARRPDAQVTATGYASTQPLAEEYPGGDPDPAAMAQNRRVEIRVAD